MARMPSWAEEEITPSIWWTLLSADHIADGRVQAHNFEDRDVVSVYIRYQLLGDDCLKYHGQLDGNLSLLSWVQKHLRSCPMVLAAPVVCRLERTR